MDPILISANGLTHRLRAILFVDVVDSVRLINLDQEGTIRRWREFISTMVRDEIPSRRGRMVKAQGDGMLVEFEGVHDAVECALAMQAHNERSEATLDPDRRIRLRMGINMADVIADDIDLYGDGVNLAARLRDLGGPNEIVISAAVRDQLTDGIGVTIEDLGTLELRGMGRPVRAFRAWPAGPAPAVSPERKRRSGDRPSIAVLPFRNLSRDPAHDFLGELIAEDLICNLSRLTDLFVISRLSTTRFRGRLYDSRNVAEVLGVRYVVSGSIHTQGSRLVMTVELTDAEPGQVLWSDKPFQGSLAKFFDLQDQLSAHIATHVVPYIRNRELQRARAKRPENLTAYERTLRAIDLLHRSSQEDMEQARIMLEAAIAADPAYAAPHAWLARWHVLRVGQGWSTDLKKDEAKANRHAEDAIDRDSTDSLALSVHGLVAAYLDKDLETAIARYDRALAINPSAASVWVWRSSALAWLGRGKEAVERSQRAIELSPFDPHRYYFNSIAGTAHAVDEQYEQAIEFCQRALRENRMFISAHRVLTISLALAGRLEEAKRSGEEVMKLEPNLTVSGWRSRYPGNASEHTVRFCEALAMAGVPR